MKPKRIIYADNAATTRLLPVAYRAMQPFLKDHFGNPSSVHSNGRRARKAIEDARLRIASIINAKPSEIVFTSGGTESNNLALRGFIRTRKTNNHLVTSAIEHHAILNTCIAMQNEGCRLTILPVDRMGMVPIAKLESAVQKKKLLVSIMLGNNEIGTIQDIASLAAEVRKHGGVFHTDAVQALGHIAVDVQSLNVDLLSGSAHKFGGPKGIGFLYIKSGTPMRGLLTGGDQEKGLRSGTEYVAGIVGMAAALKAKCDRMGADRRKLTRLTDILVGKIKAHLPRAHINGDPNSGLPGLISVTLPRVQAESLVHILDLRNICISAGSACNSHASVPSHVLTAIGLSPRQAKQTIRISLDSSNTRAEVEAIASELCDVVANI